MYVSQIKPTFFSGCEGKFLQKTPKLIDRSLLQKHSKLPNLNGPKEIEKANDILVQCCSINTSFAACAAQACGIEEVALAGTEMVMAQRIINGVYKFPFTSNAIKCILTGLIGNRIGVYASKAASKTITWIPILGNIVNAAIAGSTTYALGKSIIEWCETKQKEIERGKKIDDILKGL